MKNDRKQSIDYIIPVDIMTDGTIDKPDYFHPAFGEIQRIKERVEVLLTQEEWNEWQKLKGLDKMLWIRKRAIEMVQVESKYKTNKILGTTKD